jgi:hypothetical protein
MPLSALLGALDIAIPDDIFLLLFMDNVIDCMFFDTFSCSISSYSTGTGFSTKTLIWPVFLISEYLPSISSC